MKRIKIYGTMNFLTKFYEEIEKKKKFTDCGACSQEVHKITSFFIAQSCETFFCRFGFLETENLKLKH